MIFGFLAIVKSYSRYQKRADARNSVKVTHIKIQRAKQLARITQAHNATVRAKAQQRFIESVGIRKAQDEISKTLTPLYVQHEAIQAQEKSRNSHTYIPVGAQGIPLVNNVGDSGSTATGR